MSLLVEHNLETGQYHLFSTTGDDLSLYFDESEARDIIRQFVKAGVSMQFPDTSFNAGKLAALEQHLEDMRRIVFEDKA